MASEYVSVDGTGEAHARMEVMSGQAGERQVPGASIGFAENQSGLSGYAEAAGLAMHVLRI